MTVSASCLPLFRISKNSTRNQMWTRRAWNAFGSWMRSSLTLMMYVLENYPWPVGVAPVPHCGILVAIAVEVSPVLWHILKYVFGCNFWWLAKNERLLFSYGPWLISEREIWFFCEIVWSPGTSTKININKMSFQCAHEFSQKAWAPRKMLAYLLI